MTDSDSTTNLIDNETITRASRILQSVKYVKQRRPSNLLPFDMHVALSLTSSMTAGPMIPTLRKKAKAAAKTRNTTMNCRFVKV